MRGGKLTNAPNLRWPPLNILDEAVEAETKTIMCGNDGWERASANN
jgi:hypothetical protein